MMDYLAGCFVSFLDESSVWGIGLGIVFGAVWLAGYWPPLFKRPWLWAVLVSSAILTQAAVCFIQYPLVGSFYRKPILPWLWSHEALGGLVFLVAIPVLQGLVQEGAKLVPVVVWWRRGGKSLDPKLGLVIGAVAGAGFGILQAWGVFATNFWGAVPPILAYTYDFFNPSVQHGFLCTFFTMAAQIAFSALAGYGLAKGWGWQFYLIASALHGLLNMAWAGLFVVMTKLSYGNPSYSLGACMYTAVLGALVTAWALWLRWRKTAPPEASAL